MSSSHSNDTYMVVTAESPTLNGEDITQEYVYRKLLASETIVYANQHKSVGMSGLIHEFSQSSLEDIVNQSQHTDLQKIIVRYGGLCNIICNHVLLTDSLGKNSPQLKVNEFDKNQYGQISLSMDKQSVEIDNPFKKISIADMEKMKNTHLLKISSVIEKFLAFAFNIYPNSITTRAEQAKMLRQDGTVNADTLASTLSRVKVGDYVNIYGFSHEGLKFSGHACLIKKTAENNFSFFNPTHGESTNLNAAALTSIINTMMSSINGTHLSLQDGNAILKSINQHINHDVVTGINEQIPKTSTLPKLDDIFVMLSTAKYPDEVTGIISKNSDKEGSAIQKSILKALSCDDIHKVDKDELSRAIEYLQHQSSIDPRYGESLSLIATLTIMKEYLIHHETVSSDADNEALRLQSMENFSALVTKMLTSNYNLGRPSLILPQADLRNLALDGKGQRCAITHSNLSGANLTNAKLPKARIESTKLANANFNDANLNEVSIRNSDDCDSVNFTKANLTNAYFGDCKISRCDMQESNLSGVAFANCYITQQSFAHVNLSRSDFTKTSLNNVSFHRANLDESNLSNMEMLGVNFNHAQLRGTHFNENTKPMRNVIFNSKYDFLPKDWYKLPTLDLYLNNAKNFSILNKKMTITENLINNLRTSPLDVADKVKLLRYAADHNWLGRVKYSGALFARREPEDIKCRQLLTDEIKKVKNMKNDNFSSHAPKYR